MAEGRPQRVFVSVGSNIEPARNITRGLRELGRYVRLVGVSCFYRTPAIDRPEQPDYLNGVVEIETSLAPLALRDEVLHPVEEAAGRIRTEDRYAPRTLDLDILCHGEELVELPGLRLPDPDIAERPFLAAALLDLDPELTLPGGSGPLAIQTDPAAIAALEKDEAFSRDIKEILTHEP